MNVVGQVAAAAAEHGHGNVQLETLIYGVIAFAIFSLLALVTLSYKNVSNRHAAKAEAWAKRNGAEHGAETGH